MLSYSIMLIILITAISPTSTVRSSVTVAMDSDLATAQMQTPLQSTKGNVANASVNASVNESQVLAQEDASGRRPKSAKAGSASRATEKKRGADPGNSSVQRAHALAKVGTHDEFFVALFVDLPDKAQHTDLTLLGHFQVSMKFLQRQEFGEVLKTLKAGVDTTCETGIWPMPDIFNDALTVDDAVACLWTPFTKDEDLALAKELCRRALNTVVSNAAKGGNNGAKFIVQPPTPDHTFIGENQVLDSYGTGPPKRQHYAFKYPFEGRSSASLYLQTRMESFENWDVDPEIDKSMSSDKQRTRLFIKLNP